MYILTILVLAATVVTIVCCVFGMIGFVGFGWDILIAILLYAGGSAINILSEIKYTDRSSHYTQPNYTPLLSILGIMAVVDLFILGLMLGYHGYG